MASRIKANLAMNPDTGDLQFEIAAEAGAISIKGEIDTPGQARKIRSFVEKIPGVRKVTLEELSLVTRI
jgi:osmotically-inducible protein OsmY